MRVQPGPVAAVDEFAHSSVDLRTLVHQAMTVPTRQGLPAQQGHMQPADSPTALRAVQVPAAAAESHPVDAESHHPGRLPIPVQPEAQLRRGRVGHLPGDLSAAMRKSPLAAMEKSPPSN
jgi:hypothetical protein